MMFCLLMNNKKNPTASLDENNIEFEIQTDRNFYVDLMHSYKALKLKLVKGCGCETYTLKEVKKEHIVEESTTADATDQSMIGETFESKFIVTYINNINTSVFPILRYRSTNKKIQFQGTLCAQVVQSKRFERSKISIQRISVFRILRLRRESWWCPKNPDAWYFLHKKNEKT